MDEPAARIYLLVHLHEDGEFTLSAHSTGERAADALARIEELRDEVAALFEPPMSVQVLCTDGSLSHYERAEWSAEQKAAYERLGRVDPSCTGLRDCARIFDYAIREVPLDRDAE